MSIRMDTLPKKKMDSANAEHSGKSGSRSIPIGLLALAALISACSPSMGGGSGAEPTEAATSIPTRETSACDNPLYPVVPSATWSYHGTGGPTGEFDYTSTIESVSADGFTEVATFGELTRTINWKCLADGLLALSPGGPSASISSSGLNFEYNTTSFSGLSLPRSIAAGDTWTQLLTLHGETVLANGTTMIADTTYTAEFAAVGMESVTVAAGTFSAMRVDITTVIEMQATVAGTVVPTTLNITGSAWFAPGVGMVKTVSAMEGIDATIELTSYSIP